MYVRLRFESEQVHDVTDKKGHEGHGHLKVVFGLDLVLTAEEYNESRLLLRLFKWQHKLLLSHGCLS